MLRNLTPLAWPWRSVGAQATLHWAVVTNGADARGSRGTLGQPVFLSLGEDRQALSSHRDPTMRL